MKEKSWFHNCGLDAVKNVIDQSDHKIHKSAMFQKLIDE